MCQSQQCESPTLKENWRFLSHKWKDNRNNTYRVPLLLCNDCAFRVLTILSPALSAGDVELRSMQLNKFTLHCSSCYSEFRLEELPDRVTTRDYSQAFCPNCGLRTVKKRDPDLDYWELIAQELNLNLSLTRMLHDAWLKDSHVGTFKEFVEQMEAEVAHAS